MTLRAWKQEEDILKIVEWLWMMPFLSLPELKVVTGLTYDRCNRLTKSLYRQGKVDHVRLGMTLEVQDRYFLTTSGVHYAMQDRRHVLEWQVSEQGLRQLISRLPTVESFYRLAPRLWAHDGVEQIRPIRLSPDPEADELEFPRDLQLTRFQWQRDSYVHAISRYANNAWTPWVWVGPMTKGTMLQERRVEAEVRLMVQSRNKERPSPAGWIVVSHDHLAAIQASRSWLTGQALVTTADGRTVKSLRPKEFGQPYFDDPRTNKLGAPEGILQWVENGSFLRELNGKLNFGLFGFIAQWPGVRLRHLQKRFSHSHGEINAALRKMAKRAVIVRLDGAYYLTRQGMLAAARMDRISHQSIYASFDAYLRPDGSYRRNRQRHDQAVADIVLAWERAGGTAIHGRRAVLNVANQAQLAPDAMMVLPLADGTTRWWLVEVEFSARTRSAARRKLQGYRMYQQYYGTPLSLLMIVGTEAAAQAFLMEGRGLDILATTLDLFLSGPRGKDVWRAPPD